jgi:hypothetical protein
MPTPSDWEPPVHRWGWSFVLSFALASCQSLTPDNTTLPPIPPSHTLTRVMPPAVAPIAGDAKPVVAASTETPPPPPPVQAPVVFAPPPVAVAPPPTPMPVVADAPPPSAPATTREDALLLPLLQQEQALLQNFGPEHPQVKAVRARIAVVREYLQQYPERETTTVAKPMDSGPIADKFEAASPCGDKFENLSGLFATSIETKLVAAETPAVDRQVFKLAATSPPAPTPPTVTIAPTAPAWATATAQFLGTAAALLFGLALQVVGLAWVLRRYGSRLTPSVRVEMPQQPTVVVSRAPRRKPVKPKASRLPVDPRDAGILQQVFEDNLRLHDELTSAA